MTIARRFDTKPALDQRDPATPIQIVGRYLEDIPVDLDAMADDLGLEVRYVDNLSDDVSGKIERTRGGYRVTVNASHPRRRQRFTLAHEIAHFIMHRDLIGDGIVDNAMYRSAGLSDEIERQANRYAADILMPAAAVRRLYRQNVKSFAAMANAFDVSAEAAQVRMKDLRVGRA
ncbi:ImmA/IrrE family metallo-endopeptidase [Roseomonas frigidaquae]|uniref:ImmA/IrrE family metallo-endopeptidase n=1 Tax=Falsiroseomonas frigidaquae TaxID=487318 RepID=A0ABX1EW15_9PROT|nr:ImmA/IrrE family metallo-endopeptidase [Falsiroseomonas frigidaquae]NKE43640.1 ImmA/IrrE family metallo-endopeptidase [Falsiroseomonas frigidaquae]